MLIKITTVTTREVFKRDLRAWSKQEGLYRDLKEKGRAEKATKTSKTEIKTIYEILEG